MASTELSITLSIAQLLQFEVCASLSEGQPSLQLGTLQQSSLSTASQDLSSVDIKFETQTINGQRMLRVFAIPKAGPSRTNNTPCALSSADVNAFQYRATHPEDLAHDSSASYSKATSAVPSPAGFNSSLSDELIHGIDYEFFLSSFSGSDMCMSPLGSVDHLPLREGSFTSQSDRVARHASSNNVLSTCNPPSTANYHQVSESYSELFSALSQLPSPAPSDSTASAVINASIPNTAESRPEEDPGGPRRRARRFACLDLTCRRKFASKYTLGLHMSTHQPGRQLRYSCQMGCSETFSRQHDRLRHEVSQHGRVSEWACIRCRHVFSSQSTLEKHKCSDLAGAEVCR